MSYVRTGKRRYAVHVHRENAADVVMDPAPGYDDHIPHDLVHLFVETYWGLRDGIFGQLAVGGDAQTFIDPVGSMRERRRMKAKNRLSGSEIGRSELLAGLVQHAWQLRHSSAGDAAAAGCGPAGRGRCRRGRCRGGGPRPARPELARDSRRRPAAARLAVARTPYPVRVVTVVVGLRGGASGLGLAGAAAFLALVSCLAFLVFFFSSLGELGLELLESSGSGRRRRWPGRACSRST